MASSACWVTQRIFMVLKILLMVVRIPSKVARVVVMIIGVVAGYFLAVVRVVVMIRSCCLWFC